MMMYNEQIGAFDGEVVTKNNTYDFLFPHFEENQENEAMSLGNKIASWLDEHLLELKIFVSSQLLQVKNEGWLEEGEKPRSHQEFMDLIELEGISAYPEGNFEVYFLDMNLFFGHNILVKVSEDFKFDHASLAG